MPLSSIYPTHAEIFVKKYWELGELKIFFFFESAILIFFFASFLLKSVQIYMVEWMGQNFDVFPGFQKIPCYA